MTTDMTCVPAPGEDALVEAIGTSGARHAIVGPATYRGPLYAALSRRSVLARYGVGHDGTDKAQATQAGLLCTNTPDVLHQSVADLTMLLIGAAARHLLPISTALIGGRWAPVPGVELQGLTLTVVGCGRIGRTVARIASAGYGGNSGAHNTIFAPDGRAVYLGGLRTNTLGVVDPETHRVIRQIGPLGGPVRPFTINGAQTLAYINVNGLLGFEIADIRTGELLHRIDVTEQGFEAKPPLRHGVFSHGVGLTPDETEVWVADGANEMLHVYDNAVMPPVYKQSIKLRKQPGWISFSLDGRHADAPTGEIVDVATKKVIAQLVDETGALVKSEKMVEIHLTDEGRAVRAGDQFGIGRVVERVER